ncbi:hypothetical protein [Acetobacter malorum]|uniref:hypothetical protein n=1 Tax=Acetobacter malorum TaxID=178901 RepID=UPI0039E890F5
MTSKPGRPPVQFDLLGAQPGKRSRKGAAQTTPAHKTDADQPQRATPARRAPRPKAENPLQTDLFTHPLPPRPRPPRTHLDTAELRLSAVPATGFSPQATPDSWLYLVTEPDTASQFLADGLPLRKTHPLLLTERGGVAHWLTKMTDDPPGLFAITPVVLRLRRTMVSEWLEPDPDHSAEFSAPCYLLSGSR